MFVFLPASFVKKTITFHNFSCLNSLHRHMHLEQNIESNLTVILLRQGMFLATAILAVDICWQSCDD